MAARPKNSEAEIMEQYRIALENVENQPEISSIMAELGYAAKTLSEGKTLLSETRNAYNHNQTEDDETSAAYHEFARKKDALENIYNLHRKKAKVIFRNDSLTSDRLAISGSLPRAYMKWLESVKKFYDVGVSEPEIQNKLIRLKITSEELTASQTLISELETARAEYLKEKGESQDATKQKDMAFTKLDDWMSEFYAVAKIGLEDSPQLLEALGKTVRG